MTRSRELKTFSFNDFLTGPLLLGGPLLSGGPFHRDSRYEGEKNQLYFQGAVIFVRRSGGGGRRCFRNYIKAYTRKKTLKAEPPDWRRARALPTRRSGVYLTDWSTG